MRPGIEGADNILTCFKIAVEDHLRSIGAL
jgi:hypothetical protein